MKCMWYLKGDKCKCGCTDPIVRLECVECGKEPFVCNCAILMGDTHFRVVRLNSEGAQASSDKESE